AARSRGDRARRPRLPQPRARDGRHRARDARRRGLRLGRAGRPGDGRREDRRCPAGDGAGVTSGTATTAGARRRPAAPPRLAAALACTLAALALLGPRLGGADPGLPGPIGFASESLAALTLPVGVLLALAAVGLALRRHAGAALATLAAALAMLVPEAVQ